ncbi:MAG: hypothetical protein V4588_11035 [Pseudomonadota bacterium]
MTTEDENALISKHMLEYAKLMQAEAEKMELLGIVTTPNLFDKFFTSRKSSVKNLKR